MTVRTCQDVVDVITAYLDGALPATEHLSFERHVAICPPCRAYLAQMRRVVRTAPLLREDDLAEPVRATLLAAFEDWHGSVDGR